MRDAETAGEVAREALAAYASLASRWQTARDSEWTVFAALAAVARSKVVAADAAAEDEDEDEKGSSAREPAAVRIVSMATGSKCLGPSKWSPEGLVLNDCHAEVLARRGLCWLLLQEQRAREKAKVPVRDQDALLAQVPSPAEGAGRGRWRLRADVDLYLFVSELPCGDCSVLADRFSGAKLVADRDLRETEQVAGQLRAKSSRSNLRPEDRSLSMSCSDKIARWRSVGLQSALVSARLEGPVPLRGLVLSADCLEQPRASTTGPILGSRRLAATGDATQEEEEVVVSQHAASALQSCWRATHKRLAEDSVPLAPWSVTICSAQFPRSKASAEAVLAAQEGNGIAVEDQKKRKRRTAPATGLALQWVSAPSFVDEASLPLDVQRAPIHRSQPGVAQTIVQTRGDSQDKKKRKKKPKLVGAQEAQDHAALQRPTPRPLTCKRSLLDVFEEKSGDTSPFVARYKAKKLSAASEEHRERLEAFFKGPFVHWRHLKEEPPFEP